jgi:hypothetical protein
VVWRAWWYGNMRDEKRGIITNIKNRVLDLQSKHYKGQGKGWTLKAQNKVRNQGGQGCQTSHQGWIVFNQIGSYHLN